ncbi:MAG: dihydrodipicolinate synthase family protein [Halobacteriales archaeon]|nr:dihydrodipicolinate synthase family protein [Halobacteriales archaeon]
MQGTGLPLVTPFDANGVLDEPRLRDLVEWVEERGVDFIVPCGSNSEAELMTVEERSRATEVVVETADVPVLAGTGHPGLNETIRQTESAAEVGADAALVVTPFYFNHDQDALQAYYEELADAAPIPIYLYSVPKYTGVKLAPETVGRLAAHDNIQGMKDSSGDLATFQRERSRTADEDFDLLVGSGGIYAPALDAGADGGVLALANIAPERASEIYSLHSEGNDEQARALNRELVELNTAVTGTYGIPGLKAAMRMRDAPVGQVRSPHQPVDADAEAALSELIEAAKPA